MFVSDTLTCPSICSPAPGITNFETCWPSTFDTLFHTKSDAILKKDPDGAQGQGDQMTVAVKYSSMKDMLLEGSVGSETIFVKSFQPLSQSTFREHGGMQAIFPGALWHELDYE